MRNRSNKGVCASKPISYMILVSKETRLEIHFVKNKRREEAREKREEKGEEATLEYST